MKKKVIKKLTLKKTTIADLNAGSMRGVKGGAFTDPTCYCPTAVTCNTCPAPLCETGRCHLTDSQESYCDCTTVDRPC